MTATTSRTFVPIARNALALLVALGAPFAALAHHAHDYAPPANALEALLSGLAHPALSLPHLAALIVIGLLAGDRTGSKRLMAAFCAGSAVTALVFAAGLPGWPLHDAWVSLSLALGGLCLWKRGAWTRLEGLAGVAVVAIAGSIHGQIAAESIEATQAAILTAYWVGIIIAQLAIAGTVWAGWQTLARNQSALMQPLRFCGAALSAGVAVTVLLGVA